VNIRKLEYKGTYSSRRYRRPPSCDSQTGWPIDPRPCYVMPKKSCVACSVGVHAVRELVLHDSTKRPVQYPSRSELRICEPQPWWNAGDEAPPGRDIKERGVILCWERKRGKPTRCSAKGDFPFLSSSRFGVVVGLRGGQSLL